MKKWNSLKNLKSRGTSEDISKKNLKRQASSPYLVSSNTNKSNSLNKNYPKKLQKNAHASSSNFNNHTSSLFKTQNNPVGTKSSHSRDYAQGKNKTTLPRSLSSKKIKVQNQSILDFTANMNPQNSISSTKKLKRSSKISWKENKKPSENFSGSAEIFAKALTKKSQDSKGAQQKNTHSSNGSGTNPFLKKKKLLYNYIAA